jgi:peptidoglycan hydrolase-like protein with peptidoglycan-binding domain
MAQDEDRTRAGRRRIRIVSGVVTAAAVLTVTAGTLVWLHSANAADDTAPVKTIGVKTVAIKRTDLSTSRSLPGTLGYGAPRAVKAGREGVVTWLPKSGTTIKRGETLYRINDAPVPLFTGEPPLYRTIGALNMTGRDVAMVAKNLKALGYAIGDQPRAGRRVKQTHTDPPEPHVGAAPPPASGGTAPSPGAADRAPTTTATWVTVRAGDGVLTTALTAAIKKWQRDQGMQADGTVDVGDLAVLPGAVRVDAVSALAGDAATGDLMSVSQTTKVVTVQATVDDAGGLSAGGKVTLSMPDGAETPGKIGDISAAAQTPDGAAPGAPQTVAVTVTMTDPGAAGKLTGGSVTVKIQGETHKDVLAVPVTALLALREGGYAIELDDGRKIAVETGMFSGGMVEISGTGVTDGLMAVTTS